MADTVKVKGKVSEGKSNITTLVEAVKAIYLGMLYADDVGIACQFPGSLDKMMSTIVLVAGRL